LRIGGAVKRAPAVRRSHALGIGAGAGRAVIDAVALAAQENGFATLWAGEHVVMVDNSQSWYPYSDDGKIAVPSVADWNDPLIGLAFAAAATTTIRVATGVLLLPEHNPVLVAKQAATLDRLSGGRFTLGIGIGWSKEEFDALGIPFQRRGRRAAEYVAAMRTLWRDDIASFAGEFVNFQRIRVNPKPVRNRRIPIMVGGNSDAAMRRLVGWGDGWYGFNLADVAAATERVELIGRLLADAGRDRRDLHLAVALRDPRPTDVPELARIGIDELVIVEGPPDDAAAAPGWVGGLARRWMPALG
jgi:probable F420-dependent oxidoreductase